MIAALKQAGSWSVAIALVVNALVVGSMWGRVTTALEAVQEKVAAADTRSLVNASEIAVFSERFLASQKILDKVEPINGRVVAIEENIKTIAEFVREQKRTARGR